MDPAVAAITSAMTTPCVQPTNTPVSFASTTQVRSDVPIPPTVNPVAPSSSMGMVPTSQNPGVSSTVNTQSTSQPQEDKLTTQHNPYLLSSATTAKERPCELDSTPKM